MPKYFYQFPINSPEGRLLTKFYQSCIEAERKAQRYAKRMGATSYFEDPNFFAGGVSYLAFENTDNVNTNVWRLAHKTDDGIQWYEPNTRTTVGCIKVRHNFTPSDTAGRIYKKTVSTWDEVRQLYTLNEWLAFVGFHSSGDKEIDTKAVVGILKDKFFYTYIDIIPMTQTPSSIDRNTIAVSNKKRSRDASKAIFAEQQRMKLPTVRTEDLYAILHADTAIDEDAKKQEQSTPVFFPYMEHWYLGLDFPIHQETFIPITPQCFTVRKNQMLRDIKNRA